jgi:hypothetical protein
MKYLVFILLCFFGWFAPKAFVLIQVDSRQVAAGRVESGVSSTYSFSMIANYNSTKLSIEDLWVDSVYYRVFPFKQNSDLSFSQSWEAGDTIQFRAVSRYYSIENKTIKDNGGPEKLLPKKYNGDALIGYKLKGKQYYHVVENIKKLPKLDMP